MAQYTKNILRTEGKPGKDPQGKVWISPDDVVATFPWTKVRIELFNYNIGGNVLKKEHKEWLKRQLIPFLRLHKYHVELHGRTSASGSAEFNRQLSLQRVLLLKEFLVEEGGLSESQVPGERMRAHGEDQANQAAGEDEHDRAVSIVIRRGRKSRPLPIRIGRTTVEHVPPSKKKTPRVEDKPKEKPVRKFLFRYAGGLEGGLLITGFAQHYFEVIDDNNDRHGYMLQGPIKQLDGPLMGSVTDAGDRWFTVNCRMDKSEDLAGKRGIYWAAGGGNSNPSWLSIPACEVYDERVPTGTTIGLGLDQLNGRFIKDKTYDPPPMQ